jgi:phenylacetate-CoA ligase
VLRPAWSKSLSEQTLRTGEVVGPTQDASLFGQTVGEHILVRGRWLSIPLLRRALAGIDGIAGWRLEISRGDGTLDKLILNLAFERASLVENPMWAGRAREAIASITPIAFEVATELARNDTPSETIDDQREHHLGFDRQAVAKRLDDPRGALGG